MGARSELLAKQFEVKAREALATLKRLSEADWKKVTEAEKWSVGVTAHHLASTLDPIASMIKAVAAGLLNHIDEHFGSIRKTVGSAGKEASA